MIFEAAIPRLREIRNPLTHPNDDEKLDQVGWFSSVVSTGPDGRVSSLVDPRYGHHDAAMAYHAALTSYLRAHMKASIESDLHGRLEHTTRRGSPRNGSGSPSPVPVTRIANRTARAPVILRAAVLSAPSTDDHHDLRLIS